MIQYSLWPHLKLVEKRISLCNNNIPTLLKQYWCDKMALYNLIYHIYENPILEKVSEIIEYVIDIVFVFRST